jgi:hypothetical protein
MATHPAEHLDETIEVCLTLLDEDLNADSTVLRSGSRASDYIPR